MSNLLSADQQAALVEGIGRRDPDAEADFVRLFTGRLRMMIAARVRDRETVRDLAQEALLASLTALRGGELRDPERLAAFVYGVGRNVANNHVRRQQAQPVRVPLDVETAGPAERPVDLEEEERRRLAERALDVLGPDERHVLTLTLVEGLKPGEIARRLRLSVDVVRTRKSRALKKVVAEVQRLSRFQLGRH